MSQGYGVYGDQIGYAHGTIDAELAVQMALQWHTLGENMLPLTEQTFTTFVLQPGANLPAAEAMTDDIMLVPGGIYGRSGFIDYWNEYLADPPGPFDPADPTQWPGNSRGDSYIDFVVPPDESINVEWVEVKVDISGPAASLDFLRLMLVSPDGTQSELNHYFSDPSFNPVGFQPSSRPVGSIDPAFDIGTSGSFVWTFSSNRNWGENTNSSVILNALTGEPVAGPKPGLLATDQPIFRDWELHIENWSGSDFVLSGLEVVWHGKSIATQGWTLADGTPYSAYDLNWQSVPRATRIQGFVGIDENGDNDFNYDRYLQEVDPFADPLALRASDIDRLLDFTDVNNNGIYDAADDTINQEGFAANTVVEIYRVNRLTGLVDATPIDRFLTGADGNYYFDVDPTYEYELRVLDPLNRPQLEDVDTAAGYLQHYKQTWRVTPDWFYAPDRDNPGIITNEPGEIFFGLNDANGDGVMTSGPLPFLDYVSPIAAGDSPVPMAVKNINFLLKQEAPVQEFDVTGTVYADLNGNGIFDGNDAFASNVFVYQDVNRNGVDDLGEQRVLTDVNGQYTLTIPAMQADTYAVGVIPPSDLWLPTDPGHDGVEDVFAGPGSPTQIVNFFLDPPNDAFPDGGIGPGSILGVVFNDLDGDGTRDPGDNGIEGFRVFIDANENGVWENATEVSVLTSNLGSFSFSNVTPGLIRLDIVIPNEGLPSAAWSLTAPVLGYREVTLGDGGSAEGIAFGVDNLADNDWGDLPNTYLTTAAANGPRHFVTPGFQLGASVDGEVDGIPTPIATGEGLVGDNDNGVVIVSNGGILKKGENTLRVTVAGVGGLLTGWMDFNADGHFDESERLSWSLSGSSLGGEADINPGTHDLQITIPVARGGWCARHTYPLGRAGPDVQRPGRHRRSRGLLLWSELPVRRLQPQRHRRPGRLQRLAEHRWPGRAPFSGADGNGDGTVSDADYDVWRSHFGQTLPPPAAGALIVDSGDSGSNSTPSGGAAALAADATSLTGGSGGGAVRSLLMDRPAMFPRQRKSAGPSRPRRPNPPARPFPARRLPRSCSIATLPHRSKHRPAAFKPRRRPRRRRAPIFCCWTWHWVILTIPPTTPRTNRSTTAASTRKRTSATSPWPPC